MERERGSAAPPADTTGASGRYERRLREALRELDGKGVGRWQSRPPGFRVLRRLGLRVRPGYFGSPVRAFLFDAVSFSAVFGLLRWLASVSGDETAGETFREAVVLGIGVAIAMALLRRYQVSRLGLRRWEELGESGRPSGDGARDVGSRETSPPVSGRGSRPAPGEEDSK